MEAASATALSPKTHPHQGGSSGTEIGFHNSAGSRETVNDRSSRKSDVRHKPAALDRSKSVTAQHLNSGISKRSACLKCLAGNKPMLCPRAVPLDLLFFRRIFSNLHRRYGNGQGEVPVAVFQRSVVRLLKVLGMNAEFNASEYDVDGSGAVGWYEFVTCWQRSKMSVHLSTAEQAFLAMEDPGTCFVGQVISIFLTTLILFSCVCFILGTLPSVRDNEGCPTCEPEQPVVFDYLEAVCVGVFTLEYVVRLTLAPLSRNELLDYEKILELVTEHQDLPIPSWQRRLVVFLIQPMNVIDLFVIVPFYLELVAGFVWSNLTVLRVLRLTRLFRLVKLGRYFEVLQLVVRVMNRSLEVLNVLFIYLMLGMCFSSALMYVIEGGTWDSKEQDYVRTSHEGEISVSPFKSIPHACWWCIVTFTTVGYGDVVPVTVVGKLVASCTMIAGVLVLAMPISAISLNFGQVWEEWVEERRLEAESRHIDVLSVTKALEGMESRSRLLLELYDDALGGGTPEFLGEVIFKDIPVDALTEYTEDDAYYELEANLLKKPSEKVAGKLLVGYTWRPERPEGDGSTGLVNHHNVRGTLEVRIQKAGTLLQSDWKKAGLRDVYCEVHCWPVPPTDLQEEGMKSHSFRTATEYNTLDPAWGQSCTFEYDWPRDWRPVEGFWSGASASFSGSSWGRKDDRRDERRDERSPTLRARPSRIDVLSDRPARHPLRTLSQASADEQEEEMDVAFESEWSNGVRPAPSRRGRTLSQVEQARLECIHGFYRTRSPLATGNRTEDSSYSDMLAPSRCDEKPLPPLALPQDGEELPVLRRCVEEQGRELQSLSSRMAEMQTSMARLEALLLKGRAVEADTEHQPFLQQRVREQPLPTLLKGAGETSILSAQDAARLPAMPGSLIEGQPPD